MQDKVLDNILERCGVANLAVALKRERRERVEMATNEDKISDETLRAAREATQGLRANVRAAVEASKELTSIELVVLITSVLEPKSHAERAKILSTVAAFYGLAED